MFQIKIDDTKLLGFDYYFATRELKVAVLENGNWHVAKTICTW